MERFGIMEVLDVGTCRRCHLAILKVGRHWWHLDRARYPALIRYCRTATGNQSLSKHWVAKP